MKQLNLMMYQQVNGTQKQFHGPQKMELSAVMATGGLVQMMALRGNKWLQFFAVTLKAGILTRIKE